LSIWGLIEFEELLCPTAPCFRVISVKTWKLQAEGFWLDALISASVILKATTPTAGSSERIREALPRTYAPLSWTGALSDELPHKLGELVNRSTSFTLRNLKLGHLCTGSHFNLELRHLTL